MTDPQQVSFHYLRSHRGNRRVYIETPRLSDYGFKRGQKFLASLDDKGDILTLSAVSPLLNQVKLNSVSGKQRLKTVSKGSKKYGCAPVIDLCNKMITQWLQDHEGFWVHYRNKELVLSKTEQADIGPCVKQNVIATLVAQDGDRFVETNYCFNPQKACPRDLQGMKTGEGYELCINVCQQKAHAEVNAIRTAKKQANGSVIYLQGHTYACENCSDTALRAGVKEIILSAPKQSVH